MLYLHCNKITDMRKIVYNAIQTPDGTVLESIHRHDYQTYVDTNGKTYMVDGGLSYVRRSDNGDEVLLTKYEDQPHEQIREYAFRSGYGKPGTSDYGTYRITRIADMDDEYLNEAIKYVKQYILNIANNAPSVLNTYDDDEHPFALQVLLNEKQYRNK
jgi:hypothetical protein